MIGEKLGPYEILESIGSGGMGEVWKARDTRLGRIVAIKKVKEQHSERFKQEARSIAALNHQNICQIFDIGDDYLVLEYVEGKPLSSPLPEQETIRLAIQIASALEEAHQHGIIHRDLKPSNIMVTEKGSVKLLDFGLAKLYEQDASISSLPTADLPATQAGAILGTVAYMSPEQAQGKPADARSDIFSFGLLLYEVLSGNRAFSGDSTYTVMDAIVRKDPPPLQTSPPLQRIVKRCLQKNPSARYQRVSEIRAVLENIVEEKVAKSSSEPQPSIAVLPFVNMSGDKEQEYFSDGLAEEIINALTKVPGLQVIARTSAFAFKGKRQDITEIAKALRVSNILEGSVRKSGNRIRVTAQLIEASKGVHLWSERYDRDLTDVFAVQDEISHSIAEKLSVQFSADRPLIKRHTENIEAYNAYLKGRFNFYRATLEGTAKSKEYFEQAVALDPNYALAWYGIAKQYWYLGFMGYMSPGKANAQSMKNLLKALELDEMLPEAHAMVGMLHAIEFNWKEAEREFNHSLELDPQSEEVWINYAHSYLVPLQRVEEAIPAWKSTMKLDPLSPSRQYWLGYWYYFLRQWDLAIEQFQYVLELDPQYGAAHIMLGLIYTHKGKRDEAVQSLEKAIQIAGLTPLWMGYIGNAYAVLGLKDRAQKLLEELQKLQKESYAPPYSFAAIYLGLGEIDKAFDWFEKTVDEHNGSLLIMSGDVTFDQMRSHPRYKALLRKMNLEP